MDDVAAKMIWLDGRAAEVYKEDKLYSVLNEITTPNSEYITALIIKAKEVFCFYGNGIQIADAYYEFERLKWEQDVYLNEKNNKKLVGTRMPTLPSFSLFGLAEKVSKGKETEQSE